jgi:hypothetical protein
VPTTNRAPSQEHDRDETSTWVTLASMFVGQRLDKWSAVGAYVAAAATLAAAVIVLLSKHH